MNNRKRKLWIYVEVWRGIPAMVEAFETYQDAKKYEATKRETINLENNETGIFEISI